MKNKIREVIYEEIIKGQHHVLTKLILNNKLSHYEYYVGIPKEHPYYRKSDNMKSRWFKEPDKSQEYLYKISKSISFNNTQNLRKVVRSLKEPFRIKNINDFNFDSVVALEHAWLSFSGNFYEFLKEDYCYYGGGMYVPSFGDDSCKKSSEIALKLLGNHFLKVHDISPKYSDFKINFEGREG